MEWLCACTDILTLSPTVKPTPLSLLSFPFNFVSTFCLCLFVLNGKMDKDIVK